MLLSILDTDTTVKIPASNIPLKEEGFKSYTGISVAKDKIQRILKDTFYYGTMKSNGKFYTGNHTPIISKALFDKAQEVAEKRKSPHAKNLFFPLRGFITCAYCDCMYTATLKKGNDYYYCTNGKGICEAHKSYMRENALYKKFIPILESLRFDEEIIDILYEAAKEQKVLTIYSLVHLKMAHWLNCGGCEIRTHGGD